MYTFREELQHVVNRFSKENGSNTPDFILAEYLDHCLSAFDNATLQREKWYGLDKVPGETIDLEECGIPHGANEVWSAESRNFPHITPRYPGSAIPQSTLDALTFREQVIEFLKGGGTVCGEGYLYTAEEISSALRLKTSSISSLLKRMTDSKVLERLKGIGPLGGYGYRLKVK